MIVLIVDIRVRPESVGAWKAATLENARASRKEAGVIAFELLGDRDDPTRFALVEKYRDDEAMAEHKKTAHYARWVEVAEPLQAAPRSRVIYHPVEG